MAIACLLHAYPLHSYLPHAYLLHAYGASRLTVLCKRHIRMPWRLGPHSSLVQDAQRDHVAPIRTHSLLVGLSVGVASLTVPRLCAMTVALA